MLKTIAALVNYKCKTFIKLTPGYMNVFDWLANQLTSKQDRTFAMIGQ